MEENLNLQYLTLLRKLRDKKEKNIELEAHELEEYILESNNLFSQIKTTTEMLFDAQIFSESTKMSQNAFEKKRMGEKLTTQQFIDFFIAGKIDEYFLRAQNACERVIFIDSLRFPPRYLSGQRQRATADILEDVKQPAKLNEANDEDATISIIKKIKNVIKKYGPMDIFRLVIDPNSYAKTIENLFYLAFAVKIGQVGIEEKDGILIGESEEGELNHAVITLEYEEYKRMIDVLKIEKAML